ncbi:MAG: DUF5309 family protein [Clostridiales bacterium]|nr:DUF5309 family protein [Clostridiales bacterium]
MADNVITSFGVLNYSGMLFNKGNTKTPFSTLIGGKRKSTNHVEFVTGLEYATGGGEQPEISETASLTAPDADFITREQKTNVTQIFQESVKISYAKQSNMGTLSGINIAGQQANPANELDFQIAAKMAKIGRDIEYTFINGEYVKATADTTANQTRGMLKAIDSNVITLDGNPLRVWDVAELMKLIYDSQAPLNDLVLWVDPVALFQLNADAEQNGNTIVPANRNVNGISISTLLTPLGEVGVYLGEFLPQGTVMLFNPGVVSPVEQPTPEKGNFFLEELAKVGAGVKYQIFGQIGLDHGSEWYHGKITGISTKFEKPKAGKKIYAVDPIPTTDTLPVIDKVVLGGTPTEDSATDALEITYIGTPTEDPTLAYQWKIGDSAISKFEDIVGADSATYTPEEEDVGRFIKCEVTATGTATGKVLSNAKKVVAK